MFKHHSLSTTFKRFIINADNFGTPIGLTYKNKRTFQSFLGGCVTIICQIFVFVFLALKVKSVYDKDSTILNYSFVRDLYADHTSYHLTQDIFDFGVRVYFE